MKQILRISIIAFLVSTVWSQTTGKISGTVTGDDGTPLVGANVVVLGTGSGASSNADGEFQIINVPAGSYVVKASYIGYTSQEVSGVRVISGLSTPVDLSLSTSTIEGDVVQVMAERPLIQKDETSSVMLLLETSWRTCLFEHLTVFLQPCQVLLSKMEMCTLEVVEIMRWHTT